ncbi:aminobenzoyl-glutamate transporter [Bdellovibrio bacteriovorus]|uniref:Aminobenzoyl-glutamate transporter n=1 Tax=Bdellovibrio bacteriovorus TaxID=959 RepID=A0A150WS13_BDEBC|nr:AbgT family transporter [Bdellovibrio bacteriovorus]KYG67301.1 aminobenzoyl-glutamate transporter [Bdellovibrio bacteriovorus]
MTTEQNTDAAQEGKLYRFLLKVEKVGNALPQPALMFLALCLFVIIFSALATAFDMQAVHPVTKEVIKPVNLMSAAGLSSILTDMIKNFTGFAPLGTVLVAMLGFSLAEKSGLLGTVLRSILVKSPRALIIPAVLLAGIMSHTAGDVGYVLLIPLSAMAFHSVGLHPLAGLAICFAGVSGGFSANFIISALDPLLSGLSQEAARIIDPQYSVTPLVNWYFMSVSSILIIAVGTIVAKKITLPFLGEYKGDAERSEPAPLSALEKRGLLWAGIVAFVLIVAILIGTVPESGFLRNPTNGSLLDSPFLKGIIAIIFFFAALTGLVYGWGAKTFRSQNDVTNAMQESMATMAPYLVMVFFAAQFIALFSISNMGLIMAVHGSDFLKSMNLSAVPLMIGFIILTCVLDIFIGSASAKWALMAPVFVPMFMILGLAPELTQASYRIADSVVNIISPLMPYFPLILAFANKYDPRARVGTLIALMLPYSIAFLISWSILLFIWIGFELPLGPGAHLKYIMP